MGPHVSLSPVQISGVVAFVLGGAVLLFALANPRAAVRPSAEGIASADSLIGLVFLAVVTAMLRFLRLWIVGSILMAAGAALVAVGSQ